MRDVTITLEGITAYSSSKGLAVEKKASESHNDFEKRIWRERSHYDDQEHVYIPGVAFKMALDEAARVIKEKIPGKGNSTWTKIFETGCSTIDDMYQSVFKIPNLENGTPNPKGKPALLPMLKSDLKAIAIYCHSNGQRGSGNRVTRYFPYIPTWGGSVTFRIFNDALPQDVFERFFTQAGILSGVGRGRPSSACAAGNGRFKPVKFDWKD